MLGVNTDLARLLIQRHSRFLRRPIALPVVTWATRSDEILPGGSATPRPGHNVIQCKFSRRQLGLAILARAAIPKDNSLARDGVVLPRHAPVPLKPYDAWKRNSKSGRANRESRHLLHHGRAFKDKRQGAPRRADIDRLIAGVNDQN